MLNNCFYTPQDVSMFRQFVTESLGEIVSETEVTLDKTTVSLWLVHVTAFDKSSHQEAKAARLSESEIIERYAELLDPRIVESLDKANYAQLHKARYICITVGLGALPQFKAIPSPAYFSKHFAVGDNLNSVEAVDSVTLTAPAPEESTVATPHPQDSLEAHSEAKPEDHVESQLSYDLNPKSEVHSDSRHSQAHLENNSDLKSTPNSGSAFVGGGHIASTQDPSTPVPTTSHKSTPLSTTPVSAPQAVLTTPHTTPVPTSTPNPNGVTTESAPVSKAQVSKTQVSKTQESQTQETLDLTIKASQAGQSEYFGHAGQALVAGHASGATKDSEAIEGGDTGEAGEANEVSPFAKVGQGIRAALGMESPQGNNNFLLAVDLVNSVLKPASSVVEFNQRLESLTAHFKATYNTLLQSSRSYGQKSAEVFLNYKPFLSMPYGVTPLDLDLNGDNMEKLAQLVCWQSKENPLFSVKHKLLYVLKLIAINQHKITGFKSTLKYSERTVGHYPSLFNASKFTFEVERLMVDTALLFDIALKLFQECQEQALTRQDALSVPHVPHTLHALQGTKGLHGMGQQPDSAPQNSQGHNASAHVPSLGEATVSPAPISPAASSVGSQPNTIVDVTSDATAVSTSGATPPLQEYFLQALLFASNMLKSLEKIKDEASFTAYERLYGKDIPTSAVSKLGAGADTQSISEASQELVNALAQVFAPKTTPEDTVSFAPESNSPTQDSSKATETTDTTKAKAKAPEAASSSGSGLGLGVSATDTTATTDVAGGTDGYGDTGDIGQQTHYEHTAQDSTSYDFRDSSASFSPADTITLEQAAYQSKSAGLGAGAEKTESAKPCRFELMFVLPDFFDTASFATSWQLKFIQLLVREVCKRPHKLAGDEFVQLSTKVKDFAGAWVASPQEAKGSFVNYELKQAELNLPDFGQLKAHVVFPLLENEVTALSKFGFVELMPHLIGQAPVLAERDSLIFGSLNVKQLQVFILDDVREHIFSVQSKNLPVDTINCYNHMAILLRWAIEKDVISPIFKETFPELVKNVLFAHEKPDLRVFIRDKLQGLLLLSLFEKSARETLLIYYAGVAPCYPSEIDNYALRVLGMDKYASPEVFNEGYLFVPFDEHYYAEMSKIISVQVSLLFKLRTAQVDTLHRADLPEFVLRLQGYWGAKIVRYTQPLSLLLFTEYSYCFRRARRQLNTPVILDISSQWPRYPVTAANHVGFDSQTANFLALAQLTGLSGKVDATDLSTLWRKYDYQEQVDSMCHLEYPSAIVLLKQWQMMINERIGLSLFGVDNVDSARKLQVLLELYDKEHGYQSMLACYQEHKTLNLAQQIDFVRDYILHLNHAMDKCLHHREFIAEHEFSLAINLIATKLLAAERLYGELQYFHTKETGAPHPLVTAEDLNKFPFAKTKQGKSSPEGKAQASAQHSQHAKNALHALKTNEVKSTQDEQRQQKINKFFPLVEEFSFTTSDNSLDKPWVLLHAQSACPVELEQLLSQAYLPPKDSDETARDVCANSKVSSVSSAVDSCAASAAHAQSALHVHTQHAQAQQDGPSEPREPSALSSGAQGGSKKVEAAPSGLQGVATVDNTPNLQDLNAAQLALESAGEQGLKWLQAHITESDYLDLNKVKYLFIEPQQRQALIDAVAKAMTAEAFPCLTISAWEFVKRSVVLKSKITYYRDCLGSAQLKLYLDLYTSELRRLASEQGIPLSWLMVNDFKPVLDMLEGSEFKPNDNALKFNKWYNAEQDKLESQSMAFFKLTNARDKIFTKTRTYCFPVASLFESLDMLPLTASYIYSPHDATFNKLYSAYLPEKLNELNLGVNGGFNALAIEEMGLPIGAIRDNKHQLQHSIESFEAEPLRHLYPFDNVASFLYKLRESQAPKDSAFKPFECKLMRKLISSGTLNTQCENMLDACKTSPDPEFEPVPMYSPRSRHEKISFYNKYPILYVYDSLFAETAKASRRTKATAQNESADKSSALNTSTRTDSSHINSGVEAVASSTVASATQDNAQSKAQSKTTAHTVTKANIDTAASSRAHKASAASASSQRTSSFESVGSEGSMATQGSAHGESWGTADLSALDSAVMSVVEELDEAQSGDLGSGTHNTQDSKATKLSTLGEGSEEAASKTVVDAIKLAESNSTPQQQVLADLLAQRQMEVLRLGKSWQRDVIGKSRAQSLYEDKFKPFKFEHEVKNRYLVTFPVKNTWEIWAALTGGKWEQYVDPLTWMVLNQEWYQKYQATAVEVGPNRVVWRVPKQLDLNSAEVVARQMFCACPKLISRGLVKQLAEYLTTTTTWILRWDD